MKSNKQITYLTGILALLLLSACNKETETVVPAPEKQDAPTAIATQAEEALGSAPEMNESTKQAAESVQQKVEQAKETVAATIDAEKDTALQVIQSVKELVSQAKYTEALAALSKLSIDQLSPELQGVANQLKEQAEKALASTAAGKAGETISNVLKDNNIPIENPLKR